MESNSNIIRSCNFCQWSACDNQVSVVGAFHFPRRHRILILISQPSADWIWNLGCFHMDILLQFCAWTRVEYLVGGTSIQHLIMAFVCFLLFSSSLYQTWFGMNFWEGLQYFHATWMGRCAFLLGLPTSARFSLPCFPMAVIFHHLPPEGLFRLFLKKMVIDI